MYKHIANLLSMVQKITENEQKCSNIYKNNKVTVTVVLRGRERGRQDSAKELLNTFAYLLEVEYEQISTQNNRVSGKIEGKNGKL